MKHFIAIDPGTKKCGIVLVDIDQGIVRDGLVVAVDSVVELIQQWQKDQFIIGILLGNGTNSSTLKEALVNLSSVEMVEERGTTLLARKRFWKLWPPTGWRKFIPIGLRLPSVELDAIAALLILEIHFKKEFLWPGSPNFKILP